MPEYIVKVSVSRGQARITIPKELAVKLGVLTEDGTPGDITHLIFRGNRIFPGKIQVE